MSGKKRKKIALIVNTLSSGGAEHVAANLSRALSERYDVDIILNDGENIRYPYEGRIITLGMPPDSDRMSGKYQLSALIKRTVLLKRLKNENKYAAAYSFSDNTNLSNVLSGARFGRTVISARYSLAGKEKSEKRKSYINRLALAASCVLANTVVSCSEEIGDELKKKYLCRRGKLRVIYNGVDPGEADNAVKAARTDGKGNNGRKIPEIISAGRLSEQKAQWHLLYALKVLKDRGIEAHLTILGEGPLRSELEDLCRELGIEGQVSMPGWVQDPYSYYADADTAVFTSSYEGFSNAILEALACGVPCISTDHSTGAREILAPETDWHKKITDRIERAQYGILVPVCEAGMKPGAVRRPAMEEKLLADAIQAVVTGNYLADRYRKAGPARARELSLDRAVERWAKEAEKLSPRTIAKIQLCKVLNAYRVIYGKCPDLLPDELFLKLKYYKRCGRMPELKEPQTYNEKILWLKLHNRNELYTLLADKSRCRYWAAEKIGPEHIIPILGIWDDPKEIEYSTLPDRFVIKCTHDSGSTMICKDKSNFDYTRANELMSRALKTNYYLHGREWAYKNVPPRVIAEPYLVCRDGSSPAEYKVYCFDGRAEWISLSLEADWTEDRTHDIYDRNFNLLNLKLGHPNSKEPLRQKPETFDQVLEYAECLSQGISHVRVDFYDVDGEVYFGEMTFYPFNGFAVFDPPEWNNIFGDRLRLPEQTDDK